MHRCNTCATLIHFALLTQVEDYSNRVANYFLAKGFKKGDTVAFYMPNRPEYIIHWYAK